MKKKLNNKNNRPIENHKTAAWSDIKKQKKESKVPMPSEMQIENAKEWVDKNEK